MEGFLLFYGVLMINKLKQLSIAKKKNNKIVLFMDGKPPVIKNYTKTKRDNARKNRLKNKIMTGEEEDGQEGMTSQMSVSSCLSPPACLSVFSLTC